LYVCPYCTYCKQTQRWLTDFLSKEYEHRVAPSIDYARRKDTLRQQLSQVEQRARQLRLKFAQEPEQEHRMQEQRMLKQRQQEDQRKAQQREEYSGVLGEHWRKEKEFRSDFDATVQHLMQEWKLKPEPPKASEKKLRFVRTSVRPARP